MAQKKKFRWRKWNNILHRDIGYLAVGMSIIYALSGIALNHLVDWNPSYEVTQQDVVWSQSSSNSTVTKADALAFGAASSGDAHPCRLIMAQLRAMPAKAGA